MDGKFGQGFIDLNWVDFWQAVLYSKINKDKMLWGKMILKVFSIFWKGSSGFPLHVSYGSGWCFGQIKQNFNNETF